MIGKQTSRILAQRYSQNITEIKKQTKEIRILGTQKNNFFHSTNF
jgi:hypothetical protein